MKLKLISCEILYREMCFLVARSRNQIDVEFLPKGLHDLGAAKMLDHLQGVVDAVDPASYSAIVLGYGLCGTGLVGLKAPRIPMVVPRAHDCITFFLGSKERYLEYFHENPGVYFRTTGWIERGGNLLQLAGQASIQEQQGGEMTYEDLAARYGDENARYIWEQLGDYTKYYRQLTFIETGIEPDGTFEECARQEAGRRGWAFEKITGNLSLLERLLKGEWDEADFLVVPPGSEIAPRYDAQIIEAKS
ncbi:MAG: DUF1638 domain-containing protein [Acidobacteria bacterium]|nr:MAG: DUF1638 domain-containing protein [Acidobacteriota bacterium]